MKPRTILFSILALCGSNAAYSAPTVEGFVISWPDDGWYQVQNASTYETLCQGTRSCTVPAGKYIVINHTTGTRHTGIEVTDTTNHGDDTVTVSGNTISWPDDGWYQVQNASTYETLCQGTRSCTVPTGKYIVINHTTGTRHTGIEVTDTDPGNDTVTVSGNTISWPDDGWYQVQNASTYETLCQGTRFCTAPAGEYIVINHTTGKRHTSITVTDTPDSPAINRDNYLAMLTQAFEVYMGTAYDERLPTYHMGRLTTGSYTETRTPLDSYIEAINRLYTCQNGGTVDFLYYSGISPEISLSYTTDQCQYQGEVINGKWSIDGYREVSHDTIQLDDFSVEFSPQGIMTVDGGYRSYTQFDLYAGYPHDYTWHWRTEDLDYHFSYDEGSLVIENATTLGYYGYYGYTEVDENDTSWNAFWDYTARMEGEFDMKPPFQPETTVSVSTPVIFNEARITSYDFSYDRTSGPDTLDLPRFDTGELLLAADDGSTLQLNADNDDSSSAQVTIQNKNGEESFSLPWSSLDHAMRIRSVDISWPQE